MEEQVAGEVDGRKVLVKDLNYFLLLHSNFDLFREKMLQVNIIRTRLRTAANGKRSG